jgi:hypothetical protein
MNHLPQSITEVYLEINGSEAMIQDPEDFDPLCSLGPKLFRSLRRLHTLDIYAWLEQHEGKDYVPENAVFYRRLPYRQENDSVTIAHTSKAKEIWTTRMDFTQERKPRIQKKLDILWMEINEKAFEGEDAKEVWCNGYENVNGSMSASEQPLVSGPFSKSIISSYPMFKQRI